IPDFDLVMLSWIVRGCHVDSSLRVGFSLSYALSYRETSIFVKTKASIEHRNETEAMVRSLLDAMPSPCYSQGIILTPRPKDIDDNISFRRLWRLALRSPSIHQEEPQAPTHEAAASVRGPLGALLRFRAFEALRHREYRLIWYG